jgi:hypothetical protein
MRPWEYTKIARICREPIYLAEGPRTGINRSFLIVRQASAREVFMKG